jgi:hypothetical protein
MPTGFFEEDGSGDLQPIASFAGTVDMWFELDGSGDIQPRAVEAEPNFPAEGSVRLSVAYGYSLEYIGSYTTGGTGAAPTPPTLAVANGGANNGTATISGADGSTTNTVYSQPWNGTGWTARGTTYGDGSAVFTLNRGAYWFHAISENTTSTSSSNVVFATITGTADPLHMQILESVRDAINAASLTDASGASVTASIAWPPEWGSSWRTGQVFVFPDSDKVEPAMTGIDVVMLGVNACLCQTTESGTDLTAQLDIRDSIEDIFVGKRLSGMPDVWCPTLTESKVFNEAALQEFQGVVPLTFLFETRVRRT